MRRIDLIFDRHIFQWNESRLFNEHFLKAIKNRLNIFFKLLTKKAIKCFKKEREFWNKTLSEWFPDYKPKEIYF